MKIASTLAAKAWSFAAALVVLTSVAARLSAQTPVAITGTVRNAVTGSPIANATVRAVASKRFSVTGGDGRYRLVTDAGELEVRVTAVGFAPDSQIVSLAPGASAVIAFTLQPSAVPLDEVVTVGTRAVERTVSESPVPVDVISSQLLENTGMIETWQQLQRAVPSLNVPHIPIGDNHMRPITLRGLAPHHVLVLVNGKRRHPASVLLAGPSVPSTGFTDLNAIPSGAIERIEVLRDGASAQYGSDAIGGVVNIILKSGEHRDFETSAGEANSSEGGRDFHDGRLFDAGTTLGFASANGASLTLTGELRNREGTNRAYPDKRQQYFTGDSRNDEAPRISSYLGDGTVHALSFFLTGTAPITSTTEAYVFGGASDRNSVAPDAFFRRPQDDPTVRAIFPDGFLPSIGSSIKDLSILGGVRGTLRGWSWDVSSGWGDNGTGYHVHNSDNASLGTASPTEFYAGHVAAQQWTSNVDLSRDLKIGSFSLGVAAGAEFRVENYQISAGDSASWTDGGVRILDGPKAGQRAAAGAQGMVGFRPIDEVSARRSNSALYVEAEGHPIPRLLLQTAVRAEHYSDFGSTSDGKIAVRMQLFSGLAMRASASTGFRAPSLEQEYYSNSGTSFQVANGVTTVRTVRTFPVNTPEAKLMGATPLLPETSVNSSAGLVLQMPRLPRITADFYRIIIKNRIGLGGLVTDTSIIRLFEENGMAGIGGGRYFANTTDTRTQGVDVVASHSVLLSGSRVLAILGGYSEMRTKVIRVAAAPPQLARFQSQLFNRQSQGILENGQPRQVITLTLNYTAGALQLNIGNERAGPTAQLDQTKPAADQIVHPKWVTDARISYQLRPRVQVALSGANLFDVYPDEWWDFKDGLNATGTSMKGIFRYPGALSPFGMNGRTLYLRVVYR